MERAGYAVARAAAGVARTSGRIAVLCGPGGNGGDGFVAARYLQAWGYPTSVHLLGERARCARTPAIWLASGPARSRRARRLRPKPPISSSTRSTAPGSRATSTASRRNAWRASTTPAAKVLAVDVPSGLDGETGAIRGVAVTASATITFFRLKPGHLLSSGGGRPGRLMFADIGIPNAALDEIARRPSPTSARLARRAAKALGA